MKQKVLTAAGFILFIVPIIAIFGTAGLSDNNEISLKECIIRISIALVFLTVDAILVNYLQEKARRSGNSKRADK